MNRSVSLQVSEPESFVREQVCIDNGLNLDDGRYNVPFALTMGFIGYYLDICLSST